MKNAEQFLQQRAAYEIPQDNVNDSLETLIPYLDTYHQEEGLPHDWYRLKDRVGFSMNAQMAQLPEYPDIPTLQSWIRQTERDVTGFYTEYLSGKLVYPYQYYLMLQEDGSQKLVDPLYSQKKDLTEMADRKERNGSVVDMLEEIKQIMLSPDTPLHTIACMTSPDGPTGLTMDDGKPIEYPDAYFFFFHKVSETSTEGFAIRTDFTKRECREVIRRMNNIVLPDNATEEAYVRSIAYTHKTSSFLSEFDLINILQQVRYDLSWHSSFAYKRQTWESVLTDVRNRENLYSIPEKRAHFMEEFVEYITLLPQEKRTKLTIQKALAATILRISKDLFEEEQASGTYEVPNPYSETTTVYAGPEHIILAAPIAPPLRYGAVLSTLEAKPGCAGGGDASALYSPFESATAVIRSIVDRHIGVKESIESGGACPEIECKHCGWKPTKDETEQIQAGRISSCPVCKTPP